MFDNNWKDTFENRILRRGLLYWRDGKVMNLTKSDKKVTALVKGTSNYFVEIDFDGGTPVEMYCTCPYAAKGERCKHMAAVMYAMNPDVDRENKESNQKKKRQYVNESDPVQLLQFKDDVDTIFRQYEDRSGFISYFKAMDFQIDIERYLYENASTLIDNDFAAEAFDLTGYVFLKLSNAAIDDDGQISSIASLCYDLWKKTMEVGTTDERAEMKRWFLKYSKDKSVIDYMQDYLISFIEEELATDEDRRKKMDELDDVIEKAAGKTDWPHFSFGLSYDPAVVIRMKLMKMLSYSDEEIEEYRYAHRNFTVIRQQYMDEAEAAGDLSKLIALLQESKLLDAESTVKLCKYSEKLIEIYHNIGDRQNEKRERYWAFCNLDRRAVGDFCKIKELCTDAEWPEYKDGMINVIDDRDLLCEVYSSEQMLNELYETIFSGRDDKRYALRDRYYMKYFGDEEGLQKARRIKLLDRYGFLLASDHAQDILSAYEAWVRPIAETAKSNARYDEMADYLRRMLHYDGGTELVESLAKEWSSTYPTRKVMVQRLKEFISSYAD